MTITPEARGRSLKPDTGGQRKAMQLSNPVEQPEQRPIRLAGLLALAIAAVACALLSGSPGSPTVAASPSGHATYIVRATTIEAAEALVLEAGGRLTARLGIIDAVGARLDASQLAALRAGGGTLGIYADTELEVQGDAGATHYPVQVGADQLHRQGLTGRGVARMRGPQRAVHPARSPGTVRRPISCCWQ